MTPVQAAQLRQLIDAASLLAVNAAHTASFDSDAQFADNLAAAGAASAELNRFIDELSSHDWRPYHSALSQCAELLPNMQDGDPITETHIFLKAHLASTAGDLEFNAQRLRNVVKLVGLEHAVPQDDAALDGARGAVLGQIAAKLRARIQDHPNFFKR